MPKALLFLLVFIVNLGATERIIALSPSINEIIFALGSGDAVVGNTEYCTYPESSKKVTKVGGYFSPSLEKIVALHPSLVIMQKNNYKLSQKLNRLGIKTKIVKIDTLEDIGSSILTIGTLLQKERKAKEIVTEIKNALETLKGITANKRVLIVFGHNTTLASHIFVAGQNLYFDQIINISGNTNALQSKRKGQPVLNAENIIATNPDIVILLAHSMKEKGLSQTELINPWKALPINASRTNSIYIIDKRYAGIPSDRLVYFINDFKNILKEFATCEDRHIISQSPYITHELAFFDMQKCIVGASIYDKQVDATVSRTGRVIDPDKTAIKKLQADFVFLSDWTKDLEGITLHGFGSFAEMEANLYTIADALHLNNEKIKTFKQNYLEALKQIEAKNKRVLILSACTEEIYSYGKNTYVGDIFSTIGFQLPDDAKGVRRFSRQELGNFIEKEKIDFIFGLVPYSKAISCHVLETEKKVPIIYLDGDSFLHPAPGPLLRGLEELRSKHGEW